MGELSERERRVHDELSRRGETRGLDGHSLPSQELRELWESGVISGAVDEDRVQPSSFEPMLSSEGYWVRMTGTGGFHPRPGQGVREAIRELPEQHRMRVDLSDGRAIHPGETWIFRFEERITIRKGEYVKASPKSSIGRTFLYVRLIADQHASFDELHAGGEDVLQAKEDVETGLWVLVQPLTFSHVLTEGNTLLQLRYFSGKDARLTDTELAMLFARGVPLLYEQGEPVTPTIMEGLQIHLDLSGEDCAGVVGLRARPNPEPIDHSEKRALDPQRYFDPILADDRFVMHAGEHCLFMTKEHLSTPDFLNMELQAHWGGGFAGPKHFAGFVDNGFAGPLVLEVRSDEVDDIELFDGMPVGKLDVYWTGLSDKPYGTGIGSHYKDQRGPQPGKYFREFDWRELV